MNLLPLSSFYNFLCSKSPKDNRREYIPDIFSSLKHFPHVKTLLKEYFKRIEKNKAELHSSANKDLGNNSSSCSFLKVES